MSKETTLKTSGHKTEKSTFLVTMPEYNFLGHLVKNGQEHFWSKVPNNTELSIMCRRVSGVMLSCRPWQSFEGLYVGVEAPPPSSPHSRGLWLTSILSGGGFTYPPERCEAAKQQLGRMYSIGRALYRPVATGKSVTPPLHWCQCMYCSRVTPMGPQRTPPPPHTVPIVLCHSYIRIAKAQDTLEHLTLIFPEEWTHFCERLFPGASISSVLQAALTPGYGLAYLYVRHWAVGIERLQRRMRAWPPTLRSTVWTSRLGDYDPYLAFCHWPLDPPPELPAAWASGTEAPREGGPVPPEHALLMDRLQYWCQLQVRATS